MSTELVDAVNQAIRGRLATVHTSMPGVIVSYDGATQKAVVQPVIRASRYDSDGEIESYQFPVIPNVPILFPSSADFSIVFPLEPDDPVTLLFMERSTDEWRATGEQDITPASLRRFDLSDCVAVPGGRTFGSGDTGPVGSDGVNSSALVVRCETGKTIKLGSSSASDLVALKSLVEAELNSLWTAMNTHVHSGVVLGPASTGVSGTAGSAGNVGATKVEAE